ncbi:MAG: radical SAM family heme chaperone HemW [Clostridiales Family XIII bacterium]|jgi:oxygen-independent coproporphyrinogen-3 oxidase|nr:radical SAM family heme chaperone HemW [Clostridiales Family XIII bacterium]
MTTNKDKPLGIYIHIPFCLQKCRYCDFLSFAAWSTDSVTAYAEKLIGEISGRSRAYGAGHHVDTIYLGGGTPSLLPANMLDDILDAVYARYPMAGDVEVTLEANPGTVFGGVFQEFRDIGINRLSVGAQSFSADMLKYLGRIHLADDTADTVRDARKAGFDNISLDLMFGLPGETLAEWLRDLDTAINLGPEHLSFYSLTPEEGTPVFDDIINGRVSDISEIDDRLMYHRAIERLAKAGYAHYEISNAAKPGFASRHNMKYWSLGDYLGLGLGAHSYFGGRRFGNTENMADYISAAAPEEMTAWEHVNTASDDISEYIFLGLRRTEGIDLRTFGRVFGRDFWDMYKEETDGLIERGLLAHEGEILKLTPLGLDLSNRVFMEYV